jgi:hypothetical protein
MPVSKKPRSKTLVKTSPEAGAPAALPDRRAMESFLAAIAGHRGDDSTAKAQDVIYEAWERTTPVPGSRSPIKHWASRRFAPTLMSFWPRKPDLSRRLETTTRRASAGELTLGPKGFKQFAGHFWGLHPRLRPK